MHGKLLDEEPLEAMDEIKESENINKSVESVNICKSTKIENETSSAQEVISKETQSQQKNDPLKTILTDQKNPLLLKNSSKVIGDLSSSPSSDDSFTIPTTQEVIDQFFNKNDKREPKDNNQSSPDHSSSLPIQKTPQECIKNNNLINIVVEKPTLDKELRITSSSSVIGRTTRKSQKNTNKINDTSDIENDSGSNSDSQSEFDGDQNISSIKTPNKTKKQTPKKPEPKSKPSKKANTQQKDTQQEPTTFLSTKKKPSISNKRRSSTPLPETENNKENSKNQRKKRRSAGYERKHNGNTTDSEEPDFDKPSLSNSVSSMKDLGQENKVCLLATGLSPSETKWLQNQTKNKKNGIQIKLFDNVQTLIKSLEPKKNKKTNSETKVTHVITGINENNLATRTIKYMVGILFGAHIVTIEWMKQSCKKGCLVDESKYSVGHDRVMYNPNTEVGKRSGPYYGRLAALGLADYLFENHVFVLAMDNQTLTFGNGNGSGVGTQNKKKVKSASLNKSELENIIKSQNTRSLEGNKELCFLLELARGTVLSLDTIVSFMDDTDVEKLRSDTNYSKEIKENVKNTIQQLLLERKLNNSNIPFSSSPEKPQSSSSKRFNSVDKDIKIVFIVSDDLENNNNKSQPRKNSKKQTLLSVKELSNIFEFPLKPVKWVYDCISVYKCLKPD
ncbi:hypothetical protein BB558_005627 [Smittium angustum]|uniref:BRCT domain-containing protein n=2 Tax=Smittium angustum TaxID=133377 RepID=A0A2U1IZX4_SMIAN|nr:hypothetical protein BB558_005627 [Smittium angustum]